MWKGMKNWKNGNGVFSFCWILFKDTWAFERCGFFTAYFISKELKNFIYFEEGK